LVLWRIRHKTKYLTKNVADCHQAHTGARADHAGRLADALLYEPCSPTCANWLRYGIQPKRDCNLNGVTPDKQGDTSD